MDREEPSSRRTTWLTGLVPAPPVAKAANGLRRTLYRETGVAAPLPPLVSLGESSACPAPPVTGVLPKCDSPLVPGPLAQRDGWLFWEIHSGGWIARLVEALSLDLSWTLFPPIVGIPVAPLSAGGPPRLPAAPTARWRALHLAVWEVDIPAEPKWWREVAWRLVWLRRLRRAPSAAGETAR